MLGRALYEMRLDRVEGIAPAAQKLTRAQKRVQQIIGDLKYIEKGVMPGISLPVHRLSCIMSAPPESATEVAESVLAFAYAHRNEGITFGGGGISSVQRLTTSLSTDIALGTDKAPRELEVFGDATWDLHSVYGLVLTYYGGAVHHATKRIATICDSSMRSESIATAKGAEMAMYAREILRGLGVPPCGPTFMGTDNKANMLVARDSGSATRSKHYLRTYYSLREKQMSGLIDIGHVRDGDNPADFLTKWLPKRKLADSLQYVCNVPFGARASA